MGKEFKDYEGEEEALEEEDDEEKDPLDALDEDLPEIDLDEE